MITEIMNPRRRNELKIEMIYIDIFPFSKIGTYTCCNISVQLVHFLLRYTNLNNYVHNCVSAVIYAHN